MPSRDEIELRYQWRVDHIFPAESAWEEEYQSVRELLDQAGDFAGHLGENGARLLSCLRWLEGLGQKASRVYAYAMLKHDEDTADPARQTIFKRAQTLQALTRQATAFVRPEILSLPAGIIDGFLAAEPGLALYEHYLADLLRRKEHVLSPELEALLAQGSEVSRVPYQVFTMLNNADLQFPTIEDEDGALIEVSRGRYGTLLQNSSRRVRVDAFKAYTGTYAGVKNTLAASLDGAVKVNIFDATARKYTSALAAALHDEAIDPAVYDNLVSTVRANLAPLHRYADLRRRHLKLDSMHLYDLAVPLVPAADFSTSYAAAGEVVQAALAVLGPEYAPPLAQALTEGWIDVYENRGKRSGAYSMGGAYGVHPYVLLNWQDDLDSVFTLAHELGHAMHSHFSQHCQPYIYSGYTIFVAEVASTVNEGLLVHHLLQTETDPTRRAYILNHYLEEYRRTVFAQVLLAEFEQRIHEQVANHQPLTAESLTDLYYDLARQYWGPAVTMARGDALGWTWIPHFYYGFYVYKYAVGFSTAMALVEQILTTGEDAVERYLTFLKSGSSDYSLPLLKRAGVDLLTPAPIAAAMERFAALLTEFEAALAALPT